MAYPNTTPAYSDSQYNRTMAGIGAGNLVSGIAGLFGGGGKNPADVANKYINQIPGKTGKYFDPYIDTGGKALGKTYDEYGNLIEDPGGRLNEIGGSFQQSPGFKFALQQALQGAGHAAAAGGMAGSPAHEQQNMQLATDLANQDYYNWLGQATGLYGKGLEGLSGISQMGLQAGTSQADMIAQALAQQAQYAYEGEKAKNEAKGKTWSNIGAGIGGLASAFLPWK